MVNTMRKYAWLLGTVAAALVLAGCGDDTGASSFAGASSSSSSSSSSGTTTNPVTAITMVSSAPQIASSNSTPVTITATLTNASDLVVTGVPIAFAIQPGDQGVLALTATSATGSVAGTSDSNGQAEVTLTTPDNPTNRNITVTATVGKITSSVTIAVVGTKIALTGPASLIQGASGTFSASLTDSAGNGIANTTVTAASAKGNTLSASSLVTDATGNVTFTVTGTNAGDDTVTVTALGQSATSSLSVSSQSFSFTSPATGTSVALGASEPVTLQWTNAGAPVTGQAVSFSTTRGLFTGGLPTATGTTDNNGNVTLSLASTTAGPGVVTASATGVSAELQLDFVATNPTQIDLQASPDVIPTAGQSTITAIVRDANNNLVQNQTVSFTLTDKTGGSISVATATTSAQGVAKTVYSATGTASTSNGVTVTAALVNNTAITSSVTLTVGGQTVFLSLGTGNLITPLPAGGPYTQYSMPFAIQALDSAGQPVVGATVTLTVVSLPPTGAPTPTAPDFNSADSYAAYRKGYWFNGTDAITGDTCSATWCQVLTAECLNEDILGTGIYNSSEDVNGNGKLDPGNVATVSPGSVTTDSSGSAYVAVIYPEDHAEWVQVVLTATTSVTGTQASTTSTFWLPILSTDIDSASVAPPGATSPYGKGLNTAGGNVTTHGYGPPGNCHVPN